MDANFVYVALRPISERSILAYDGIPSEPDTCLQLYVYLFCITFNIYLYPYKYSFYIRLTENSGTSYTSLLVRTTTGTKTGTNYGTETVGEDGTSVAVFSQIVPEVLSTQAGHS